MRRVVKVFSDQFVKADIGAEVILGIGGTIWVPGQWSLSIDQSIILICKQRITALGMSYDNIKSNA